MNIFLLVTSLFLISSYCFSHVDYEIITPENSSYRSWSLDELKQLVGEEAKLLPYYECKNRPSNDIFFAAPKINKEKNSLKIQLFESEDVAIYRKGRFLNSQGKFDASIMDNRFIKHAANAFQKLEMTSAGSKLLRHLEKSFYPLTIVHGGNLFASHIPEISYGGIYMSQAILFFHRLRKPDDIIPFRQIGNGGEIRWAPSSQIMLHEDDGVIRMTPPEIILAHELYHAFDSIRGLLNFSHVRPLHKKDGQDFQAEITIKLENFNPAEPPYLNKNLDHYQDNVSLVSEYRAIYFENLVRKELSYKLRSNSNVIVPHVDLLDKKKRSLYIPAPCLNL